MQNFLSLKGQQNFQIVLFGILLVLLALASWLIPKGEVVLWVNSHHSGEMDHLMRFITHFGEGWVFLPLIIASLFVRFSFTAMASFIAILNGVVCAALKRLVFPDSLRPIQVLDNDLLYLVPNVDIHSSFSFPSGHTATIVCMAVLAGLIYNHRWLTTGLVVLALGVGYSRIYLLQHFLIDVAGGAAVAIVLTYGCWWLLSRYYTPAWMNQMLQVQIRSRRIEV